ncbi:hypothetical protein BACCIP111895_02266 [Neobacillus rhizosphaerae]|uniref:Uncharacterized protein n=1 Tax=Neobacillus rhizosphaerae TaxID=2880965 RepID=A0ABM9ER05_9BACI|nr:hypothetical protein BACCIP111895_02266 [Neobacillus rhizosphaerae]
MLAFCLLNSLRLNYARHQSIFEQVKRCYLGIAFLNKKSIYFNIQVLHTAFKPTGSISFQVYLYVLSWTTQDLSN